jgi:hypothetical protein
VSGYQTASMSKGRANMQQQQQQQQQQSKMYTRGALQALAGKNGRFTGTPLTVITGTMITIVYGSILRPSSNNWASYLWLK